MPSNWGIDFTVGAVPVFKYLESRDVDEVGYTLRTASLMTDPEYFFDERDPSDYQLFAIHYLILPAGYPPPVPARLELRAGSYTLWTLNTGGYIHVGTIVGTLTANRTNIGARSIPVLRSRLAQHGEYLRVAFDPPAGGRSAPPGARPSPHPRPPAGSLAAETDHLDQGEVAATVSMRHPGLVVLSASFDPGWTATIDGRPSPPRWSPLHSSRPPSPPVPTASRSDTTASSGIRSCSCSALWRSARSSTQTSDARDTNHPFRRCPRLADDPHTSPTTSDVGLHQAIARSRCSSPRQSTNLNDRLSTHAHHQFESQHNQIDDADAAATDEERQPVADVDGPLHLGQTATSPVLARRLLQA